MMFALVLAGLITAIFILPMLVALVSGDELSGFLFLIAEFVMAVLVVIAWGITHGGK